MKRFNTTGTCIPDNHYMVDTINYDVRHMRLNLYPNEDRIHNAPWNIAVDFTIDMSFLPEEIATMLEAYEEDGHLDMVRILDRFQALMKTEYRQEDEKFIEREGRLLFLCFLKPIINGTGFYYVEPQTRTNSRMDIVVTYMDEEFIIELKIWRGDMYRRDGIKQLNAYLDSREQKNGYLVSFSFLKDKEYSSGIIKDIKNDEIPGIEDKIIYEVVV